MSKLPTELLRRQFIAFRSWIGAAAALVPAAPAAVKNPAAAAPPQNGREAQRLQRQEDPMTTIPKGHPVAVVYYRYDKDAGKTSYAHEGFYYVHNGYAFKELTIGQGQEALIAHVPRWSSTPLKPDLQLVTFCAEGQAPDADAHKSKYQDIYNWEKDEATDSTKRKADDTERLWVCKVIQPYSEGSKDVEHHQPITWVETKNLGHPNNGTFEAFEAPEHKGGSYVLHYWDWRNKPADVANGESARTATDWKKFHLTQGQEEKANMAVVSCGPEWVHLDITWH